MNKQMHNIAPHSIISRVKVSFCPIRIKKEQHSMPPQKNTRPSPSESASSFPPGTQMQGNDGHTYVVKSYANQSQRWIKVPFTYSVSIVFNGAIPYKVHLTSLSGKGTAHVYVYQDPSPPQNVTNNAPFTDELSDQDFKLWKIIPYHDVFIGTDPSEPPIQAQLQSQQQKYQDTGFFSKIANFFKPSSPWWFGGNSLLLKSKKDKYIFIGESIFSFSTPSRDKITSFSSPMGNSAVPYPFAVGQKYTYLFLEHIYVPNSTLRNFHPDLQDPYVWFYQHTSNLTSQNVQNMQNHQKWQAEYSRNYHLPQFKLLLPQ